MGLVVGFRAYIMWVFRWWGLGFSVGLGYEVWGLMGFIA